MPEKKGKRSSSGRVAPEDSHVTGKAIFKS